jgi:hypothetical protein
MAQAKSKDPNLPVPELAKMVRDQFGLSIHPRVMSLRPWI